MDFKAEDFNALQYNVQKEKENADLLQVFPAISRLKEFQKETLTDKNKIIRYIILCYDKKSPLLSEKNLNKRKILSARLAGFGEQGQKDLTDEIIQIIQNKNETINRMVCAFVRHQRDMDYALMIAGLEAFYDNLAQLSSPSTSEDKMKDMVDRARLYEFTQKMISSIQDNAKDVFNGDVALLYTADDMEGEETGRITSYPEYIAAQREDGTLIQTMRKINADGLQSH